MWGIPPIDIPGANHNGAVPNQDGLIRRLTS